jgi:hypothetical protein
MDKIMFIEETLADGDIFISGNSGCSVADIAASVEARAEKIAGRPGIQA